MGLTTSLIKLYHSKEDSIAKFTSEYPLLITSNETTPTPEILGIYNSVTLTPTPGVTKSNTTNPQNNRTSNNNNSVVSIPPVSINKNEIYTLINNYRNENGLTEVEVDLRLENSSTNKARHMVDNNYFDHGNPWSFINDAGYSFKYASENLAVNYYSSSSIIRGWKESPSHNKAMLDERNQQMGFSYLCEISISTYENTCLAVIHFGSEN